MYFYLFVIYLSIVHVGLKVKKKMFLLVIMNLRDLLPGNLVAKESDTKIQ